MSKKAIKFIVNTIKFFGKLSAIIYVIFYFALIVSKNKDKTVNKYKAYFTMMCKWMEIPEKEKRIAAYLEQNEYRVIAVYGGCDVGRILIKQLDNSGICVKYIIDKAIFSNDFLGLPVYRLDEKMPNVDAVIITPIWDYQKIKEELGTKINSPIISLEQIISEVKGE